MSARTRTRYKSLVALATAVMLSGCLEEDGSTDDIAAAIDPGAAGTPPVTNTPPDISGTPASQVLAGATYRFTPQASDADNDILTFSISNQPAWASFSSQTGELAGTPGRGDVGRVSNVRITVSDGQATDFVGPFEILVADVQGVNTPPTISGTPRAQIETGRNYQFIPTVSDPDDTSFVFSITNRPSWASFNNQTGELSGTPGANDVGTTSNIRIAVSDGSASASLGPFAIIVTAAAGANRAPQIGGTAPAQVEAGANYAFAPTATDADNDNLTFSISNRPAWANFNTASGLLSGTPSDNDVGTTNNIRISVSDGQESASLAPFSIQVTAAASNNRAPVIAGSPATSVEAGTAYRFAPNATDADNDDLTFSISNRPGWASFDSQTGVLAGTPGDNDVGTTTNIRISVSDGEANAALSAFSIEVTAANVNTAPVISGDPAATAMVDAAYSFTPTATDADNDTLTFSVENLPAWLQFDPATGQLSGTPSAADIGAYNNVRISVSDGTDTTALAPFDITVVAAGTGSITLSWTAPTQNTDGSALTDLAGYKFYYGTESGNYSEAVTVDDAGITSYVIEELVAGTYYLVATSVNAAGVESLYSDEVSKEVTTN